VAAEPNIASIDIAATPEEVFDYFVSAESLVLWMGQFASLDPRPGGRFEVDVQGVPVRGEFLLVERPHHLVVTWGHAGSDRFPPGTSRVEVTFRAKDAGNTVTVVHSDLPDHLAGRNADGWRHYLTELAAILPSEQLRVSGP
jgi:uncharacterized protein YndB with AHSA1/START domain